jgi:DNA (cytosine-5)-methyltransferase 1
MTLKILNGYSGIGGNRKLWTGDIEVTAVEDVLEIAKVYQDLFPNDKVIVTDAHQYLLEHFQEFDFIWLSPPCPSHSCIRKEMGVLRGQVEPVYPDMKLYEEIILLQHFFKGKFVVENVISYYEPLIKPQEVGSHYFWTNFVLSKIKKESRNHHGNVADLEERKDFDLSKYKGIDKRTVLRNCVEPELGLHIFEMAFKKPQKLLFEGGA